MLIVACTGLVAAKEIVAETVIDVPMDGTTVPVGIFGQNMNNLDTFTVDIYYDQTVMGFVNENRSYRPDRDWGGTVTNPAPGRVRAVFYANDITEGLFGNSSLFGLNCQALTNNGSSTILTVTIIETQEARTPVVYTAVNGLFRTKDEVPPTITITSPANGATVPQDVTVTATITDVGGVDQSTINVTVGGVALVNPTITPIAGGYTVTGTRNNVPIGPAAVVVSASDLAGNPASVTHNVTVAQSGISFNPDIDGTFTNATQPVIKADYVQVTGTTVKMFLNNVNVTGQATLTPSSPTAGSIELNYAAYGPLADAQYTVVVNGTSSLPGGGELTATETFTKDTIAPVVVINSIADSDGDGYPEAQETLTFAYTVTDANPVRVWIDQASSTTFPSSNLVYGVAQGNTRGNRNAVVYAVDAAGNVGQSTQFHLYNNYLAYINETSAGTFAGLDLNKTAVYNIFDVPVAQAVTLSGQAGLMQRPDMGVLQKTITAGSGVVVDNRGNDPIDPAAIQDGIPYFINPTGTMNYAVTVPNIDRATLIIGKANSSMIDQILRGARPSRSTIEEMLSKDTIVIYGKSGAVYGFEGVRIDNAGQAQRIPQFIKGDGITFSTDLKTMIAANYINLSAGFNTATATPELGLPITWIGPGEYVLLAMCLDGPDDRVSAITLMPFIVTEQASQFTTSAATYPIGDPVVVNWGGAQPQNIAGILIRDGSTYTGNVTVDLTSLGASSLKSMYLLGDGNQTVKKLIDRANIYISEGYGNAHNATNNNSLSIPTTGLIAGSFTVHMVVENNGNLTSYGSTTVTLADATTLTANFTGTPRTGTTQITTQFTDLSTGGTAPYTYHWQYNRNNAGWVNFTTPNAQNPSQTFGIGAYSIRLNVTDAASNTATKTETNYINVAQTGGGGGGGGGVPTTQETVGSASLLANSLGMLLQSYIVDSPSGVAKLNLNRNTIALDQDGNPLGSVSIDDLPAGSVPSVPGGSVFSFAGYAVTCSPAGATFSPGAQLNFEFTQAQWDALMAQAEQDPSILSVKWYNSETGSWESVQTTVNPTTRTVSAQITHFSIFALFTDTEAAIPVVTPTVTPTIPPVTPTETVPPTTPVTPVEPAAFPWTYVIIGVIIIILIAGGAYYYTTKQS
ncbi:hypothetical protein FTO68_01915 [Methanocalculus taiwanensis]|uniref:PKD domain-containing protein n=1 Tax=Methanocalculus taiwanensis TaxID=106207 RepID=A0ABD4TIY4_9EURY|nr:hypothetical protein [Methanocalculus taiwanensis]MCQ1537749.1 hypothetical protein [Methanocalculus taiwanensis]